MKYVEKIDSIDIISEEKRVKNTTANTIKNCFLKGQFGEFW